MEERKYTYEHPTGNIEVTFNDLANQAESSVIIKKDETILLVTVSVSDEKKDLDYMPLVVEYEERFYSVGAILGSRFMRRENRPTDSAILKGRIIDRCIRPFFDERLRNDVQIVVMPISLGEADPRPLGVIATSIALGVSNLPWDGPVSSASGIYRNGIWEIFSPKRDAKGEEVEAKLIVCGKADDINMIELEGKQVVENVSLDGIKTLHEEIKSLQQFQEGIIAKEKNKQGKDYELEDVSKEVTDIFTEDVKNKLVELIYSAKDKSGIKKAEEYWTKLVVEQLGEEKKADAKMYAEKIFEDIVKENIITNSKRPDGRAIDEIRPIFAKAGNISPMHHGSGIFYRGGTHIFSVLTLGAQSDALMLDTVSDRDTTKSFLHHYNFPPFSTGEVGRISGTNRRMIGHGALAEKALLQVIPSQAVFPYTIRLVSESMASNGSTSMGSVCASTLALMDGGVPILAPVAGIAIGLMRYDGQYKVITDIQGPEDHYGDMDFKIAGTESGITAMQLDVKGAGITINVVEEALESGKKARLEILNKIKAEISSPRESVSERAPKIISFMIPTDAIGKIIGSGGATIKELRANTGVEDIAIEDDGKISIAGSPDKIEIAKSEIEKIVSSLNENKYERRGGQRENKFGAPRKPRGGFNGKERGGRGRRSEYSRGRDESRGGFDGSRNRRGAERDRKVRRRRQ